MRIVYVTQYFPPEMGAPAARVSELATWWVEHGHEVTVITGFPNHPRGVIWPGYRGESYREETRDGVRVIRAWFFTAANEGVWKRSASFASFASSATLAGLVAEMRYRPDLVIATSPQLLCGLSGYALSRIFSCPFVFEVRDLWPRCLVEFGMLRADSRAHRMLTKLESFLYAKADAIVGVTRSYSDTWIAQGIPPAKIFTIENGVDLERFTPGDTSLELRRKLGLRNDAFVVGYLGTFGMAQGLGTLLEVAHAYRDDARVQFVLVGDGADREWIKSRAANLASVHVLDPVPRDEVPAYLRAFDLCAVLLRDTQVFEQVLPSKLFEIMGCERPVLLAARGEAERLVRDAEAGYVAPPEDVPALCRAIEEARNDREERLRRARSGRAYVARNYARSQLAERYLERLTALVTCDRKHPT